MRRREVDHLRAALANIHDIAARLRQPLRECIAQRRSRQSYIMPNGNRLRLKQRREAASDTIRQFFVHLVRIDATHIVCAKALVCYCHKRPLLMGCPRAPAPLSAVT